MTDLYSLLRETTLKNTDPDCQPYGHPDEVLEDARLSTDEKRALLASWASDANAVPHLPMLRQLPDGSVVKVEDIFRALKALDGLDYGGASEACGAMWRRPFSRRRGSTSNRWAWKHRGPHDDDDDPPPCPAYAARLPRGSGGGAFAIPELVAA